MKNKKSKIIVGVIIFVIFAFIVAGVVIYKSVFSFKSYDLTEYYSAPVVKGCDGKGIVELPELNYAKLDNLGSTEESFQVSEVFDSVVFQVTPNEGLSNGDKVKVTAVYDEKFAKQKKVKLTNLTKEFTVKGLMVRLTPKDITPEVVEKAKGLSYNAIKREAESFSYIRDIQKPEFVKAYFIEVGKPNYSGIYEDVLCLIYKVKLKDGLGQDEYEYYFNIGISNILDINNSDKWAVAASISSTNEFKEALGFIDRYEEEGGKVTEIK